MITIISGSGSVSLDSSTGLYYKGTEALLTAIPDPGWRFSEWSGDTSGNANPAIVSMDSDKVITATFVISNGPDIDIWYGDVQNFGTIGTPQRWINILGTI